MEELKDRAFYAVYLLFDRVVQCSLLYIRRDDPSCAAFRNAPLLTRRRPSSPVN